MCGAAAALRCCEADALEGEADLSLGHAGLSDQSRGRRRSLQHTRIGNVLMQARDLEQGAKIPDLPELTFWGPMGRIKHFRLKSLSTRVSLICSNAVFHEH